MLQAEARVVSGFYSGEDIDILIKALLNSKGIDINKSHQIVNGNNDKEIYILPTTAFAEGLGHLGELIDELTQTKQNAQVLIPYKLPDSPHWVSVFIDYNDNKFTIAAYDSLGSQANMDITIAEFSEVITAKLPKEEKIVVEKHEIKHLTPIQKGNVYCGGYTAHVIASAAMHSPENLESINNLECIKQFLVESNNPEHDKAYRKTDAEIVKKYNSESYQKYAVPDEGAQSLEREHRSQCEEKYAHGVYKTQFNCFLNNLSQENKNQLLEKLQNGKNDITTQLKNNKEGHSEAIKIIAAYREYCSNELKLAFDGNPFSIFFQREGSDKIKVEITSLDLFLTKIILHSSLDNKNKIKNNSKSKKERISKSFKLITDAITEDINPEDLDEIRKHLGILQKKINRPQKIALIQFPSFNTSLLSNGAEFDGKKLPTNLAFKILLCIPMATAGIRMGLFGYSQLISSLQALGLRNEDWVSDSYWWIRVISWVPASYAGLAILGLAWHRNSEFYCAIKKAENNPDFPGNALKEMVFKKPASTLLVLLAALTQGVITYSTFATILNYYNIKISERADWHWVNLTFSLLVGLEFLLTNGRAMFNFPSKGYLFQQDYCSGINSRFMKAVTQIFVEGVPILAVLSFGLFSFSEVFQLSEYLIASVEGDLNKDLVSPFAMLPASLLTMVYIYASLTLSGRRFKKNLASHVLGISKEGLSYLCPDIYLDYCSPKDWLKGLLVIPTLVLGIWGFSAILMMGSAAELIYIISTGKSPGTPVHGEKGLSLAWWGIMLGGIASLLAGAINHATKYYSFLEWIGLHGRKLRLGTGEIDPLGKTIFLYSEHSEAGVAWRVKCCVDGEDAYYEFIPGNDELKQVLEQNELVFGSLLKEMGTIRGTKHLLKNNQALFEHYGMLLNSSKSSQDRRISHVHREILPFAPETSNEKYIYNLGLLTNDILAAGTVFGFKYLIDERLLLPRENSDLNIYLFTALTALFAVIFNGAIVGLKSYSCAEHPNKRTIQTIEFPIPDYKEDIVDTDSNTQKDEVNITEDGYKAGYFFFMGFCALSMWACIFAPVIFLEEMFDKVHFNGTNGTNVNGTETENLFDQSQLVGSLAAGVMGVVTRRVCESDFVQKKIKKACVEKFPWSCGFFGVEERNKRPAHYDLQVPHSFQDESGVSVSVEDSITDFDFPCDFKK